jgi:hypothetical protein
MRLVVLLAAVSLLLLGSVSIASARKTLEYVDAGVVTSAMGSGCGTGAVSVQFPGRAEDLIGTDLEAGDSLYDAGDYSVDLQIQTVDVADGLVRWVVAPTAGSCAETNEWAVDEAWGWRTERQPWRLYFKDDRYAIHVDKNSGTVLSVAGLKTAPRTRSYSPTIRRARRQWGRPKGIRAAGGGPRPNACFARWPKLSLRAAFVNYGGAGACRHGYLQAFSVAGRNARQWVAVIGPQTLGRGIDTSYLNAYDIGRRSGQAWTLIETYIPYGDAGYYPSVSARLQGGHISGFDAWIGAGGD